MKLLPALIIAAQFGSASLAQAETGDLWMGTIDLPAGLAFVPPPVPNVLRLMSRVAPAFMLKQMAKMSPSKG